MVEKNPKELKQASSFIRDFGVKQAENDFPKFRVAEFKNLDDSKVLSSDFPDLRT